MGLLLTVALVHLLALASPGPDFLFVSQLAISQPRRDALAGVLGVTLGIALWAALALLGLHALLLRLDWLQRALMVGGGLYLCWLGVQLLRSAWRPSVAVALELPAIGGGCRSALRRGLFTNLANPKAVIYFASVFTGLLGAGLSAALRWGVWTLVVLESLAWFGLLATVFALPWMRRGYLRLARGIDALAGCVFVVFGLHLLLAGSELVGVR